MQWLKGQLVMLMTVSFVALVLAQAEPSTVLVAGLVLLAVTAVQVARVVAVPRAHELTVGARAREHREVLGTLPEPQHPDTDGRTRARAPGWPSSATLLSVA